MRLAVNGRFLLQDVTGVQRVAIEFIRSLDRLIAAGEYPGLEVTIWTPRTSEYTAKLQLQSIEIRQAGRLTGHAWEQLELPCLAKGSTLLCLGNTAPIARLMVRSPSTYTMVHDLSYKYFPSAYSRSFRAFYSVLMPIVLARATHIFTVSASEKSSILRCYPRITNDKRVTAVQNGGGEPANGVQVSTSTSVQPGVRSVPAVGSRPRICLYVGSMTRRKNAHGLMRAAHELVNKLDVTFVIVGSTGAIFEDLNPEATEERGRIVWLGQINDPQRIEELYRQARVLVFPSFYEASPLPPIEAMSFGTPVVCSDIPSLRERCGEAAAYCDPTDVDSIVQQVTRVLTDDSLWRDLQEGGLVHAAYFTWERQVKAVMATIGLK